MERINETDVKLEEVLYKQQGKVEVYRVKLYRTGETLCMKKIYVENIGDATLMQTECLTMALFDHPNILKLRSASLGGYDREITHVLIFMNFCEEGDLEKLILNRASKKNYFKESEILEYLRQVVNAYAHMQEKNTAHRDIKPQNIFVCDQGRKLLIGDLGSAVKKDKNAGVTLTGTPLYLSPKLREVFLKANTFGGSNINHDVYKSDVYSLGLTFLYMASLNPVKDLCTLPDLQERINKRIEDLPDEYENIKQILQKMLAVEEENRLDFIQLEKLINKEKRLLELTDKTIIEGQNIEIQEGFYVCEGCNTNKNQDDLYVYTSGILCKNCASSIYTKLLPQYDIYHWCNNILHIIDRRTFSCCQREICRYCKTFHINPDTSCLVNYNQMPQGYSGEIYFLCSQCKKLGQDVYMTGRHSSYFICCENSHYQCLVCNEAFNNSNHESCPLLFSGKIINI
ncbi:hypothetical protein SteCoe_18950 [Stentor coeruleus]|uniref:Protein kinase domain-containing protein n=1 Tax=Stentor coeruleus TaxID=5963 RepID=A0A1R2BVB0_9CILI|nr:hypothetical protein SteCoe_18950 [Stentor coeruleus]